MSGLYLVLVVLIGVISTVSTGMYAYEQGQGLGQRGTENRIKGEGRGRGRREEGWGGVGEQEEGKAEQNIIKNKHRILSFFPCTCHYGQRRQ